jgi:hypothetical protein
MQTEHKGKLSKFKQLFLSLIMTEPDQVFDTLSYLDVIKPLIHKDYLGNGGKLGRGGLAMKYKISERTVRTLLRQINDNKNSDTKKINFKASKKTDTNG